MRSLSQGRQPPSFHPGAGSSISRGQAVDGGAVSKSGYGFLTQETEIPRARHARQGGEARVSPPEPHLAALLSPALVERSEGFEETAQASYDAGTVTGLSTEDAERFGLGGVQATIDSLDQLLRLGDPNIRDKAAWTPHRPERPAKSEGGRQIRACLRI